MPEERKSTPRGDSLRDSASELRRFARALIGPVSTRTADALAQAALARIEGAACGSDEARERAFAEALRLNRRRVRERGRAPDGFDGAPGESERGDAAIAAQIAALPLDEREALLIVALAGYGYEAAARILDVPLPSVISRLMRARAQLDGAMSGPARKSGHLRVVK